MEAKTQKQLSSFDPPSQRPHGFRFSDFIALLDSLGLWKRCIPFEICRSLPLRTGSSGISLCPRWVRRVDRVEHEELTARTNAGQVLSVDDFRCLYHGLIRMRRGEIPRIGFPDFYLVVVHPRQQDRNVCVFTRLPNFAK